VSTRLTERELIDKIGENLHLLNPNALKDLAEDVGMNISDLNGDFFLRESDADDCDSCSEVMQPEAEDELVCVHCDSPIAGYDRCAECKEITDENEMHAMDGKSLCEGCADTVEYKLEQV
jgi:hypothetical protein